MAVRTSATRTSTDSRSDRSDAAPFTTTEPTAGSRTVFPPAQPWHWLGAFICAIFIYFIVLATAGSLING